ncbi:MAG: SGNH/GDSL hydrolase family protein [Myxococcales bacterium]|nr:SGNH/GDSL hydrolase family protein [Myxococcales bacterium]
MARGDGGANADGPSTAPVGMDAGSEPGTPAPLEAGGDVQPVGDLADHVDASPHAEQDPADAASVIASDDLGIADGQDVLSIGDSWMAAIHPGLVAVSTRAYRTGAVDGARVLDGSIADQYVQARAADPDIATVVMTGGGNDLFGACTTSEGCDATIEMILTKLQELWAEMAADDVQDVVMIDYSSDAGPGDLGAAVAALDQDARLRAACRAAALRCHVVDTDALVMGDLPDGIHPSMEAVQRIAVAVFELMADEGMRR